MRVYAAATAIAMIFTFSISIHASGGAASIPNCDANLIHRHGNEITVGLQQLRDRFNEQLRKNGSGFTDLQFTGQGHNKLKVSARQSGHTIAISGTLHVTSRGTIRLHANKILKDGNNEKGMMDLFGKDLANYAQFNKTPALSTKGNDLIIRPDPLLNLSGKVTELSLTQSRLTLKFALQPCR